jgi:hypothetical protein
MWFRAAVSPDSFPPPYQPPDWYDVIPVDENPIVEKELNAAFQSRDLVHDCRAKVIMTRGVAVPLAATAPYRERAIADYFEQFGLVEHRCLCAAVWLVSVD